MKAITGILLGFLSISVFSTPVIVSPAESKTITQSLKEMADATLKQDFSVLVNKMPPQFFTHFKTTKAQILDAAKKGSAKLKQLGFKVSSYTYGKLGDAYQCKLSKIVFIPITMVMVNGKKKMVSESFLIASRNTKAKTWNVANGGPSARNRKLFDVLYGCKDVTLVMPKHSITQK